MGIKSQTGNSQVFLIIFSYSMTYYALNPHLSLNTQQETACMIIKKPLYLLPLPQLSTNSLRHVELGFAAEPEASGV